MKRRELKYIIDRDQESYFREKIKGRVTPDQFGLTVISSLYYDTPDRRLITRSIERPSFKEKIRLRSYGPATATSFAYLELKRKAFGIVYKRRIQTNIPDATRFFKGENGVFPDSQIAREITYFRDFYNDLEPSCITIYDRTAFIEPDGDLRLTIDNSPRFRTDKLDLLYPTDGTPLLPDGHSILEIKILGSMPLWLADILDEGKIYKNSFSKYGEAYKTQLKSQISEAYYV